MQKNHIDVTSLPFVTPGTGGKRHCFWTPVPSIGNDCANEKRGEELAYIYLEFERQNEAGVILGLILKDMFEAGDRSIIARNFIYSIAKIVRLAPPGPIPIGCRLLSIRE